MRPLTPVNRATTTRPHPIGRAVVVVLGAFLLSQVVVAAGAAVTDTKPLASASYRRWDSGLYLSIASSGYELHHCRPSVFAESRYSVHEWCGNAGWFPGYPAAIAAVSVIGLAPATAGMLLAHLAHLAALAALWWWFLRDRPRAAALGALALAAVFPGFVYQDAVFPISLTLVSVLASLHLLAARRPAAAGAAATVAVVCYPSGAALVLVGGLAAACMPGAGDRRDRTRLALLYAAPIAAAYGATLAIYQLAVGHWNAWMLVQHHYGYTPTFFLSTLARRFHFFLPLADRLNWPLAQSALVAVLVVGVSWVVWRQRHDLDARDMVLAAYTVVFWVLPLSLGGELSIYRAEALLLPAAALTWRMRPPTRAAAIGVSAVVGLLMTVAFFEGFLV